MTIGMILIMISIFGSSDIPADAKLYKIKDGSISFFSETPVENIDATSKSYAAVINATNRSLAFSVFISSFEFKKSLMQEHFNENYMESEKYPKATFTGTINENVDLLKDGTHDVTVTGKLNIHGVEQDRTIPGKVEIKGGKLSLTSRFKVKLVDHKIEIPKVVVSNIAEVIDVSVIGNFVLKDK